MTQVEAYHIGTLVFSFLTTLTILIIFFRKKVDFFLRPSIVCILLLYVIYLLPSVILNNHLIKIAPLVNQASFLLSVVLFTSLLGSLLSEKAFLWVLGKMPPMKSINENQKTKLMFLVTTVFLLIVTGLYFYNVSFTETGLYAILCEPKLYVILREKSLKLLSQKWLIYTYLIAFSCLCPLISATATQIILSKLEQKKLLWSIIVFPIILFLIFFMLITGARVGLLNCVLAVIFVLCLNLKGWKFFSATLLVLVIGFSTPAAISMSWVTRSNKSERLSFCVATKTNSQFLNELKLQEEALDKESRQRLASDAHAGLWAFVSGTINRSFIIPAAVSGFYMEEAQNKAFNFNSLFSKGQINVSNIVATSYSKRLYGPAHLVINSATAPTAFIFLNFMYFGYFSIFFSVLGILALDLVFFLAKACGRELGIPLMATATYYPFIFVQTGYFTVLGTHGYLVFTCIILIVFVFSRNYNFKNSATGTL